MKHVFHATQQQSVTFGLVHQIKCNPLEKRHFGLYLFLHNCKVDEKNADFSCHQCRMQYAIIEWMQREKTTSCVN